MVNTNKINPELGKGKEELTGITTKAIDASIKVDKPKEPVKNQALSTNKVGDVTDIADRAKRLKVLKQKEEYKKKVKAKERMAKARAAKKKNKGK